MKVRILLPIALLVSGCTTRVVYRDPPPLPELPANVKAPCPELPLLTDKSWVTLEIDASRTSTLYVKCQASQAGAVNAYEAAKKGIAEYLDEKKANESKFKKKR